MTDWSGANPQFDSATTPGAAVDQWQHRDVPGGWEQRPEPAATQGWQQVYPPPPPPQWGGPQESSPAGFPGPQPTMPPTGPRWAAPPAPKKSRKPLWVTLAAGAAVTVVVVIVLVVTMSGRTRPGASGGSAGDMVKAYLQALARGDAETALSYGIDQPATKEFLTDDVLKKQIAKWPISNVRILSDDSSAAGFLGMAQVHVVANFGDRNSDTTLHVKNDHGMWKLPAAAIKINPEVGLSHNAAAKTLTFFAKPIGAAATYVFPGWIDVGSTNPWLNVEAKPILLDQISMYGESLLQAEITVSDKGRQAAAAQLDEALGICQHSNRLAPQGCPISVSPTGLIEGTATWGAPDTSAVKIDRFSPYELQLTVMGDVSIPITVKTTSGSTKQGVVKRLIIGHADLAKTPPAINFDD